MPMPKTLYDMLSLPTAAFVETAVLDYAERVCRRLPGVKVRYDRYGNLLAHYRVRPHGATPLVFVAHTDHPGFVALEMVERRTVRAAFRGGVKPEYFTKARVRFWDGGGWVKGAIAEISRTTPVTAPGWTKRVEEVLIRVAGEVEPNSPGMWDLPDPELRGDLVLARPCDDVGGAAAMVALLERLSRRQARGEVYCLFTRAEEVGFVGAIAAARARTVPKRLPVISIETSSALPNAPIGGGPILRVGDRAIIFTPELTAFCERVAARLAKSGKGFKFQRKLMDGGICEAFPFIAYGYRATGICIGLGNYHNMDTTRGRIGSEIISLSDWQQMVAWFEALVRDEEGWDAPAPDLRTAIDARFAKCEALLAPAGHGPMARTHRPWAGATRGPKVPACGGFFSFPSERR